MSDNNGDAGHPMNEIAKQVRASAGMSPERPAVETDGSAQPAQQGDSAAAAIGTSPGTPTPWIPLSISTDQIEAPAFFVDRDLSVQWMAPGGTDGFSRALDRELDSGATRNIFSLLLNPTIKAATGDWQTFFSLVYVTLRRSTPRDTFDTQTGFISRDQLPPSETRSRHDPDMRRFQVESRVLKSDGTADQPPWRVFGLEFSQGTLFLLRQDPWISSKRDPAGTTVSDKAIDRAETKASICMLTARLNDSQRIADSMLPEGFFKLMHLIWAATDDVAQSLGGHRAGGSGARIHYVFKADMGKNPVFSAICCAVRINRRMLALRRQLSTHQGWENEICMNMGISHGMDDAPPSDSGGCMAFRIPGGAFDQSSRLSAVAGQAEIWVTKDAVAQLPKKLIDQVVLGVDRQGRFMRNFFRRISNLANDSLPDRPTADLANLSVARIMRIEQQGPAQPEDNEV